MSLTIITPTTGSKYLQKCIESVKKQKNQNFTYYIVIDGSKFIENCLNFIKDLPQNFKLIPLYENTGANGWNGHRIYISMSFLTNSDYVMFLDEDNTLQENHTEMVLKTLQEKKLDWTFSLRNIMDKDDNFICQDKCESLGNLHHVWNNPNDFLVDVNCYCIKREVFNKHCLDFNKKARPVNEDEVDRALYKSLQKYKYETTGQYTVNYRVGNRSDSVQADFFIQGNKMMEKDSKSIYIFHLDPNWTDKLIGTNEFDYESKRYLYEDGNKTMLYTLRTEFGYKLIDGYRNAIPSGSICFFTVMDIRLVPKQILERKDIKKICYLLEGPNSWHKDNYNYRTLCDNFDKVITYCKELFPVSIDLKGKSNPEKVNNIFGEGKIEYFPFVSRFDMSNKYHKEMINKKRKYDKSIGMILANRNNSEHYEINGVRLQRYDYLRKEIVQKLKNVTVHGQGWSELEGNVKSELNGKLVNSEIKIENVTNRMFDDTNIYQFNSRFNFALIVENCNAVNYVSEKIYDAWVAGCIPIYFGNNSKGFLNLPEDCYIDGKKENLKEFIDKLSKEDIDKYYDSIDKHLEYILDKVSPSKLCKKIIQLI
jgi:dTDP-glucose pyrophosphorylase